MKRRQFLKGTAAISASFLASKCSIISSNNKDEKFSPEEITSLAEPLRNYEFGRYNIIGQKLNIKYNPNDGLLLIDPFYHFDKLSNQGDCTELMNNEYLRLIEKKPPPSGNSLRVS